MPFEFGEVPGNLHFSKHGEVSGGVCGIGVKERAVTVGHFKFTARRGVHGKVRRGAGGGTTFGVGSFERAEKSSGRIGAGLPAAGWRIPRTPASLRGSG